MRRDQEQWTSSQKGEAIPDWAGQGADLPVNVFWILWLICTEVWLFEISAQFKLKSADAQDCEEAVWDHDSEE